MKVFLSVGESCHLGKTKNATKTVLGALLNRGFLFNNAGLKMPFKRRHILEALIYWFKRNLNFLTYACGTHSHTRNGMFLRGYNKQQYDNNNAAVTAFRLILEHTQHLQ